MLCGSHRKLALDVDLDVRKTNTALEPFTVRVNLSIQDRKTLSSDLTLSAGKVMCEAHIVESRVKSSFVLCRLLTGTVWSQIHPRR